MSGVLKRRRGKGHSRGYSRRPIVFAVNKWDIGEDKHRIIWAKGGNLNTAESQGHVKRFRDWRVTKAYAAMKARQIGATKSKRSDSDHVTYTG